MLESIIEKLGKHCKNNGWSFKLRSKECSLHEVFSDFGVLAGMFKRADKFALLCEGSATGAEYKEDAKTMLGYRVSLTTAKLSEPIVMLYLLEVLESIVQSSDGAGAIALDQLTYE